MDGGTTMPQKKHTIATEDRRKSGQSVPLGDTGEGDTGVPDDEHGISNRPSDKDDAPLDPTNPASKPHGTTKDQISEMEGEGQAQAPGQEPPPNTDDK
jgi:hypothetical protein